VLLSAFTAVGRYCQVKPNDFSGLHLYGLVCERLGHFDTAIALVSRSVEYLEIAYEETEDPDIERCFSIAHANLGRLHLNVQNHSAAILSYESVRDLLSTGEGFAHPGLLAQAHFGLAVANFRLGNADAAINSIRAALETAHDNLRLKVHFTVLFARSMWMSGDDNLKETAKNILLEWCAFASRCTSLWLTGPKYCRVSE
jgi:superkiller protein 3